MTIFTFCNEYKNKDSHTKKTIPLNQSCQKGPTHACRSHAKTILTGVTKQSNEVTSNEVTENRVTRKNFERSKILKSFKNM